MKRLIFSIFTLFAIASTTVSCLEGDEANIPVGDGGKPVLGVVWNPESDQTTVNTGLNYFAKAALLYPPTHTSDTTTFNALFIGGPMNNKDINVSIVIDEEAVLDNYANDSIEYKMMPDSLYDITVTTGVIKAGEKASTPFEIVFYPSKIDLLQDYMLPLKLVSADPTLEVSQNYGIIYFHTIGNPMAGLYSWDFIRYSNPEGSGSPDALTFYDETTVFAPANKTTIRVPTGYYTQPDYLISFTNTDGVLSNFKVKIDPDAIENDWTPAEIFVTSGPTITVSEDYTEVTVKYTTVTRNVTDIYRKK